MTRQGDVVKAMGARVRRWWGASGLAAVFAAAMLFPAKADMPGIRARRRVRTAGTDWRYAELISAVEHAHAAAHRRLSPSSGQAVALGHLDPPFDPATGGEELPDEDDGGSCIRAGGPDNKGGPPKGSGPRLPRPVQLMSDRMKGGEDHGSKWQAAGGAVAQAA